VKVIIERQHKQSKKNKLLPILKKHPAGVNRVGYLSDISPTVCPFTGFAFK
jgi:hypothetical protein